MNTIFNKLPGEAYDSTNDRLIKAHQIKISNNAGLSKICDVVDLRIAAGDDWHVIENETLTVEAVDGPITDFKSLYWILNSLHRAGSTWDDLKASLIDAEEVWI